MIALFILSLENVFSQSEKELPGPSVGGYPSGDSIPMSVLVAQAGIALPIPQDMHMVQRPKKYHIVLYSVKVLRSDSTILNLVNVKGYLFTKEFLTDIRAKSKEGDKVVFYDMVSLVHQKK